PDRSAWGSESRHANAVFCARPTPQPLARLDAGDHRHDARRPLRLGRPGATRPAALLQQRPEHSVEPEVPAKDALGPREGRKPLPLHAARPSPNLRPTPTVSESDEAVLD